MQMTDQDIQLSNKINIIQIKNLLLNFKYMLTDIICNKTIMYKKCNKT